jgi:hypothetical protein
VRNHVPGTRQVVAWRVLCLKHGLDMLYNSVNYTDIFSVWKVCIYQEAIISVKRILPFLNLVRQAVL